MIKYILGIECPICNKQLDNKIICNTCLKQIKFIPEKNHIESSNNFYFNKFYTLLEFNKTLKKIIHLYKFENKRKISLVLSEIIQTRYDLDFFKEYDFIVPIPLHDKKFKKRGFNQTIKVLEQFIDQEHIFTDILKVKNTKQQSLLNSREERKANLKNIFEIPKSKIPIIKDKKILLFDDIFTTGATLNAIAKPFFYSLAKEVNVLTIGVS